MRHLVRSRFTVVKPTKLGFTFLFDAKCDNIVQIWRGAFQNILCHAKYRSILLKKSYLIFKQWNVLC